ncbi:hypothetical protein DFH09DRAFT_1356557 [Mycena vulgaris]|nr:hypothetical protein DFH09DRAFT_1356557 [Mycena vulgaris]
MSPTKLRLTVRIKYASYKARDLVVMDTKQTAEILRADLDRFRLPHPPVLQIQKPTNDGIEFFWMTYDGSPLYLAVLRTFKIVDLAVRRTFIMKRGFEMESLMEKSFMESMTLEEEVEEFRDKSPGRPLGPYNGSSVNNWQDRDSTPRYIPMQFKSINYRDEEDEAPDSKESTDPAEFHEGGAKQVEPSIVARLAREYLDVQHNLRNAAVRGKSVEDQLCSFRGSLPENERNIFETSDLDLTDQVRQMKVTIQQERTKLKMAEKILEDVLRECDTPMVIPELLKMVESDGEFGVV